MQRIYPSLMCADLLNLQSSIELLEPYVAGFHLDCMDFHFVPNLAFGPDIISAVGAATERTVQIHLMVEYPERYFDRMSLPKNSIISIHPESPSRLNFKQLVGTIRDYSWSPSIALSPATSPSILLSLDAPVDHVLIMGVNPGFAGQELIPTTYTKIQETRRIISQLGLTIPLAVDGGITRQNAEICFKEGADQLIIGSALFKNGDPRAFLQELDSLT